MCALRSILRRGWTASVDVHDGVSALGLGRTPHVPAPLGFYLIEIRGQMRVAVLFEEA